MPAHGQSCTVQLGVPVGAAAEAKDLASAVWAHAAPAFGGQTSVREALERLRADPMRTRDIGFALRLADEVAPSPAAAHTAPLVLRNLVAELAGLTTVEEHKQLAASWQ
ncbi:hypothetical protein XEUV354_08290 [Xanthomonas euvesicatoria]|nr:hypothetical protein BHE83_22740 [Xanthomonas euvesicatoria pv. vesicatoria str. 85-10]APO88639.1 hypothetical protein BJD11_00220 [Xanthomonas euvesicatoria]KHL63409.1 hypothetical protein XEU66b_02375 [Xanthomonas euvesicatoria]KLA50884.1 hypothetical protein XEUV683_17700 [Xanthomonas euvesicatoria]KLA58975.1 hypothetical protein XEUV684_12580 [Xanthomonas euvesicatoria]